MDFIPGLPNFKRVVPCAKFLVGTVLAGRNAASQFEAKAEGDINFLGLLALAQGGEGAYDDARECMALAGSMLPGSGRW